MKIFITRQIPDEGIKILREKGYDLEVSKYDGFLRKEALKRKVKGVDGLLSLLMDKIDGSIMDAAGKNLKVISNYAVGYDNIDLEAAKKRGIVVTNTPGVLTETVAEHAFALLLAIARRVVEADNFIRAGKFVEWAPMLLLGTDVYEKTLGIVGLGRIGEALARRAAKGFSMKVLYTDLSKDEVFEKKYGAKKVKIETLLKESDFVSLHVPLLPSTRHMISHKELKMMKDSAYLINTARGPVVDEIALVKALKTKEISGAALDVFEEEPKLKPGLSKLENVILTPHIASASTETRQKMSEMAAKNLVAVFEGKKPLSRVV